MVKLLGPHDPMIRFLTRLCDLMLLNIILTAACATVILSGTALTSLYSQALKMVRGEDAGIVKPYFRALRENFTSSVPATVLLFADVTLLARFDNSFRAHAGNAARLALAHLPVTFLLTLIDLAPLLSVMALPQAIGELAAFWALFGIAAGAYVNSFYLRRVFDGKE